MDLRADAFAPLPADIGPLAFAERLGQDDHRRHRQQCAPIARQARAIGLIRRDHRLARANRAGTGDDGGVGRRANLYRLAALADDRPELFHRAREPLTSLPGWMFAP